MSAPTTTNNNSNNLVAPTTYPPTTFWVNGAHNLGVPGPPIPPPPAPGTPGWFPPRPPLPTLEEVVAAFKAAMGPSRAEWCDWLLAEDQLVKKTDALWWTIPTMRAIGHWPEAVWVSHPEHPEVVRALDAAAALSCRP